MLLAYQGLQEPFHLPLYLLMHDYSLICPINPSISDLLRTTTTGTPRRAISLKTMACLSDTTPFGVLTSTGYILPLYITSLSGTPVMVDNHL